MASSPSLTAHPGVAEWLSFEGDGQVVVRSGKVDIGPITKAQDTFVAPLHLVGENTIIHTRKRKGEQGISVEAVAGDTGPMHLRRQSARPA